MPSRRTFAERIASGLAVSESTVFTSEDWVGMLSDFPASAAVVATDLFPLTTAAALPYTATAALLRDYALGIVGGVATIPESLTVAGNTVLGDATTDTITVTGRFASDLVPSTANARDLGTTTLPFRSVFGVLGDFTTSVTTATLIATTRVTSPLIGTVTAADVVLGRNSVTQLTLGSLLATFAGAVAIGGALTGVTTGTATTWNATNLGGTLSTVAQNSVTTMSALTTIGTLIAGAVPVSLLTGILPVTQGGSGLNASAVLDGQLLIGNDAANGFTLATLTGGSNTLVSNSAGAITISSTVSGGGANGRIYYPMNSVASDLAGYKVAATTPSSGATSNVSIVCPTQNAYVLGEEFATLAGEPNTTSLPAGTAIRFFFASVSGGNAQIQVNLFQYKATGDVATTGGVALTYVNGGAAADTITRAAGSFIADGFTAGCKITVAGSALNNGTYTAQTVAAGTLTLILSDVLTAEVVSSTITTKEKLLRTGVSPEFMNTSAQLIQFFYTDSAAHTLAADDRILFKWFGRRTNAGASQTITIGTEGLATASYIQTTLPVNLGLAQGTTMQLSALTASELVGTDASKTLVSLPIVTYPSLAELAYVKGLTSSAQTQITARVVSGGALGTPSSGVATNLTGTAAGLTAGNASIAPAGTLTGATLAATVLASSLTSVGTLTSLNVTGNAIVTGAITLTANAAQGVGSIAKNATYGLSIYGVAGSSFDFILLNSAGSEVIRNPTGTQNVSLGGTLAINGTLSGITTLTATTIAGTLSTAAQPNITSVGTLTSGAVPASLVTAGTFGAGNYTFPGDLTIGGTFIVVAGSFGGNLRVGGDLEVLGGTGSTAISVVAGTTARSSLRIAHGVAPTTPVNGDMWTTTAGLYVRINGATVGPLT